MLMKTRPQKALARPPRVYTYARFSSAQQGDGSSIARQDAYAERWAKENGLTLDRSLRMEDHGRSAYKGAHLRKGGALGAFLHEIETGNVIPGDALIVENLDRLSRAEPLDSQELFGRIVRAGIAIITSNDSQVYSRETLRANRALLLVVDALWMRAHEESDSKAQRARGAYRAKCQRWLKGERGLLIGAPRAISSKGTIANGTDPWWTLYNRETKRFELVEPATSAVRRVLALYRQGYGSIEIARRLKDEGLALSESWPVSKVQRIIATPALMGVKVVLADGERYELPGYYPPIITPAEYDALQLLASKRGIRKGKGEIPALVTGTKLAHCGFCGSPLVSQNVRATKASGEEYVKRRLRCAHAYARGVKCEGDVDSCNAEIVERALFDFVGVQANLDALLSVEHCTSPEMQKLAGRRAEVISLEAKLAKYERRMQDEDDPLTRTERKVLADTETAFERAVQEVARLEREASIDTHRKPSTARQWAKLRKAALDLDTDARMQVRKMIVETFSRIEVWLRIPGTVAGYEGLDTSKCIGMRVVSRHGVARHLVINRRDGDCIVIEDVDIERIELPRDSRERAATA
ncbi:recombinase family protein [Paraburkholderia sp. CNPSo 3281]|uniref:recombinase family protein n=1 Tax=Paraburkholderia sp. CNPSo 3281 TaxID=2940933 RepID=UPI0020B8A1FD|nr:recombinase family protein [Paraburkholderia sp. CNPSo 3281]MCP3719126.1 recombinase family protein [Paraburkholderia sp. CNPSo 3281]